MNDKEWIVHYAKELKFGIVRDIIDDVVSDAVQNQWDYRRFLCELLRQEAEHRAEIRKYQRIRKAGFPQMKYLQELVLEDMPEDARKLIPELETMNFIKEGRNIVMYGNPGTGKTHTAIGLGIKACMEGYSVYFTTVPHLLTQIREAKNSRTYHHNKPPVHQMGGNHQGQGALLGSRGQTLPQGFPDEYDRTVF